MSSLERFKKSVKKRNSKNFAFVRARSTHYCDHCMATIAPGVECLTVNLKKRPRYWHCINCVIKRLNVIEAAHNLNNISFGDEGGYMAALEWYDEALEEWENAET